MVEPKLNSKNNEDDEDDWIANFGKAKIMEENEELTRFASSLNGPAVKKRLPASMTSHLTARDIQHVQKNLQRSKW